VEELEGSSQEGRSNYQGNDIEFDHQDSVRLQDGFDCGQLETVNWECGVQRQQPETKTKERLDFP
jgi:hypothetical protein